MKNVLLAIALLAALGARVPAQAHAPTPPAPAAESREPRAESREPRAQSPEPRAESREPRAESHEAQRPGPATILMPHLTDSKHFEFPCVKSWQEWACHITLPSWPVHIGSLTIDMGPTKHTMWLLISAIVVSIVLVTTAAAHRRHTHEIGRPRGFAAGLEAVILYLRNEIYMPVLGHGGDRYVPFCLSLFFFIALMNVFGLIPYGSTATGNLAVTASLALVTFVMIEIAGMRALGKGYINTIVYWPHDMPLTLKLPLTLIMTPIELISKFTKPFALTVRLFANMVAGHVIILSLIGLIFLFGWFVAIPAVAMALFIMGLEVLVVFIQAFIFSLLAAVFIGQIRTAHH